MVLQKLTILKIPFLQYLKILSGTRRVAEQEAVEANPVLLRVSVRRRAKPSSSFPSSALILSATEISGTNDGI